jgi:hypothetical protein
MYTFIVNINFIITLTGGFLMPTKKKPAKKAAAKKAPAKKKAAKK